MVYEARSEPMSTNFKDYENPSIFHRWAAAQWRRPKDPTIYGATEVDMEPALAFVDRVREEWGVQVTVTHLVAKALAIATRRRTPRCGFGASWSSERP